MNIGEELAQLAREIWAWQSETFAGLMTVEGAVAKIRDECAEVLAAELETARQAGLGWGGGFGQQGAHRRREELADVFFMLVQLDGVPGEECMLPIWCRDLAWRHAPRATVMLPHALGCVEAYAASSAAAFGIAVGQPEATVALRVLRRQSLSSALDSWLDACDANDDLPHMPAAIRAKLTTNLARTWAAPASDGTISHVKPASKGGEA